jgi:hypothetical protein
MRNPVIEIVLDPGAANQQRHGVYHYAHPSQYDPGTVPVAGAMRP